VFELLRSALDLPTDARSAFLNAECKDQPAIRAEVEALLSADERAGDPDAADSIGVGLGLVRQLGAPSHELDEPIDAGRYRLLRIIGRGGMGVVYEAEQDQPKRNVAIKLISIAAMGPAALIRFRREIELLGRLSHPSIAQIHDAGTLTIAGAEQPFYAMELIDGVPISDYARTHTLSINDRLALIAHVCDAVQHAHHKGVIHRDIKPANVLVNTEGVPKVLDFGIARAIGTTAHHSIEATATGVALGTLGYMSPEQVVGQASDIDARTDIYALGALAYEILTGRPPHDVIDATLAGAFRAITDLPPTRPSTIDAGLRGDIETILLTALEKDANRRYQSAGEMAADIRRCIAGEPISAHPPSAMYRFRKFAKRNRALVTGVVLVFAALAVGTVVSTSLAIYASSQRNEADTQRAHAEVRAYRSAIAAAAYALDLNDISAARRHLNSAPPELRGWEWQHLFARTTTTLETAGSDELDRIAHWLGLPTFEPPVRRGGRGVVEGQAQREAMLHRVAGAGGSTFIDLDENAIVERDNASGDLVRRTPLTRHSPRFSIDAESERLAILPNIEKGASTDVLVLGFDGDEICTDKGDDAVRAVALAGDRLVVFRRDFGRVPRSNLRVIDTTEQTVLAQSDFKSDHEVMGANDDVIVLAGEGPTIAVLDVDTLETIAELQGHPRGPIAELQFNAEGSLLASRASNEVIIWDTQTWRTVATGEVASNAKRNGRRMAFTPKGDRLVVVDRHGTARLLRCGSAGFAQLRGHDSYVYHACYSPDGSTLTTVDFHGGVNVWDANTLDHEGSATMTSRPAVAEMVDNHTLLVLPPAERLDLDTMTIDTWDSAGSFRGGLARKLDEATQTLTHDFPGGSRFVIEERFVVTNHARSLAATRTTAPSHSVNVERTVDGSPIASIELEHNASAACFTPDDALIIIGDRSGALSLADPYTGLITHRSEETGSTIHAVAVSPDATRVATGSQDGVLRLWDSANLELLAELRAHSAYIFDLAFTPDGSQIATASGDHTVGIWDTKTASERWSP
jgi:serine/threonine protein kinase/WD40 repeat protein